MKVFLIRHASPDWERRDIPYDIHPGPMLTPRGEKEAEALAVFLKRQGLVKLYHSPFERAARTARIVAGLNGIPAVEEPGLAEWRAVDEAESRVRLRMVSIFQQAARESSGWRPHRAGLARRPDRAAAAGAGHPEGGADEVPDPVRYHQPFAAGGCVAGGEG